MLSTTKFKVLAHAEGVSFLIILFVTMPLKYGLDMGMPNKIVGMAHGVLFIAYVVVAFILATEQKWGLKKTTIGLLASIIPFGTFYFVRKYYTSI